MAFVSSLVSSLAWPVTIIALVCVVWFSLPEKAREQLIKRLREVGQGGTKFDGPSWTVQAVKITRTSAAITQSASLSGAGTLSIAACGAAGAGESDQPAEMDTKTPYEPQQLIAAAAKWGWVRPGRDAAEFPFPMVTWDKSGAEIVGTRLVFLGDTDAYAVGSFIDPNTGKPNTSARSMTVGDVDPLRDSRDE